METVMTDERQSSISAGRVARHAVFSIATNGYERAFQACIRSQLDYCRRLGVPYFLITGAPPWGISAHDSSWLKIPAMQSLLRRHREGVLYLDADCEVGEEAADFRTWDRDQPDKSLFACTDFSNRLNAAVIYCRGAPSGRQLIRRLCWSSLLPEIFVPRADRNLYENGHFIWLLKNSRHVHIMPHAWNAGLYREVKKPHILHHGGTLMREKRGEKPLSLRSRFDALWTGLRLPFHLTWFRQCLINEAAPLHHEHAA